MSLVRFLLHGEGAAVFLGCVWLYFAEFDYGWLPFVLLLLAPDIGALGFLRGTRVGAACYNATHTYLLSVALALAGVAVDSGLLLGLGLISASHIGMDRMLGYGLKFPTGFKDTHLQRLGTASARSQSRRDPFASRPRVAPTRV